jgi:hypothetical protein
MHNALVLVLALTLSGAGLAVSGEYVPKTESIKVTGYIIDNECLNRHAKDSGRNVSIRTHPTKCAKMKECKDSGHSILTSDGKLYKLDSAGSRMVIRLIESTNRVNGLPVIVEGDLDGDVLKVIKISEAQEETGTKSTF